MIDETTEKKKYMYKKTNYTIIYTNKTNKLNTYVYINEPVIDETTEVSRRNLRDDAEFVNMRAVRPPATTNRVILLELGSLHQLTYVFYNRVSCGIY